MTPIDLLFTKSSSNSNVLIKEELVDLKCELNESIDFDSNIDVNQFLKQDSNS